MIGNRSQAQQEKVGRAKLGPELGKVLWIAHDGANDRVISHVARILFKDILNQHKPLTDVEGIEKELSSGMPVPEKR